MECAKACRERKVAERKAADAEQAVQSQALGAEVDHLKGEMNALISQRDALEIKLDQHGTSEAALAAEKSLLEAALEDMRRAALLRAVYHEFDLDGGGDVGAEELMEVGQARRRLGQKSGEWTEANNRALMQHIGPDEEGIV
jgi:hypothetical protein